MQDAAGGPRRFFPETPHPRAPRVYPSSLGGKLFLAAITSCFRMRSGVRASRCSACPVRKTRAPVSRRTQARHSPCAEMEAVESVSLPLGPTNNIEVSRCRQGTSARVPLGSVACGAWRFDGIGCCVLAVVHKKIQPILSASRGEASLRRKS
jgi:hypothetical protein